MCSLAKRYNELFPKEKKEKKPEKSKQKRQQQPKKEPASAKPAKEEEEDDDDDDDMPKQPKMKDPYADLPKRYSRWGEVCVLPVRNG